MIIIGCYPSWAIYKKYTLDCVPASITHLTYCFVGCESDGSVKLLDPWADVGRSETTLLYSEMREINAGNLGYLKLLKTKRPTLNIGVSIGGSGCHSYEQVLSSSTCTLNLANQLTSLAKQLDLDYVDFDFEFPSNQQQLENYVLLIDTFKRRSRLEAFLSLPCNTGHPICANVGRFIGVDYFTIMAYDLSGPWSERAFYHSNLYCDKHHNLCIDSVLRSLKEIVSASKLILGIPLFGKKFPNCNGIGCVYSGPVICVDFDDIDSTISYFDEVCVASHATGNPGSVTVYDSVDCVQKKIEYAHAQQLAGVLFWDLSKNKSSSLFDELKF